MKLKFTNQNRGAPQPYAAPTRTGTRSAVVLWQTLQYWLLMDWPCPVLYLRKHARHGLGMDLFGKETNLVKLTN